MRGNLTSESGINRVFLKYVSFNVLSMVGFSLYVFADTLFIANSVGNRGLTALNLVLPVYSLLSGTGLMVGMGAATRYAILHAEGEHEHGNAVFTCAAVLSLAAGLIFLVTGAFGSDAICGLLGADADILPLAADYLRTMLFFSPAFTISNLLVCFIRNDGNPNLAMVAMLTGSLSNIVLDYVFIFPMGMGMFGAALATGASPVISIAVLSLHFIRRKNQFRPIACRFSPATLRTILSVGLPSFVTELSSGVIILLFNFTILGIAGNLGVAAYGIIANLALIGTAVFTGISQGIQPIISSNYGAGKMRNIKKAFRLACITAFAFGTLFYLAGILSPHQIISVFNRERDPVLEQMVANGFRIYFTAFFLMGINMAATSLFSSIAKAAQSFLISMLRGCLAVIPLILLLPLWLDMNGVWMTAPGAEMITFGFSLYFIRRYYRERADLDVGMDKI